MKAASAKYKRRIARIHRELQIPRDYRDTCRLPLQTEAVDLVEADLDVFGRRPMLTAGTLTCWEQMRLRAATEGTSLQIVSAFRSVDYQAELLKNKLAKGQLIEDILKVNAAPGHSEHHTGRALDLTTEGCEPLSETFDSTTAFAWLQANAESFGFSLSYPRANRFGIAYEPWHWICVEE